MALREDIRTGFVLDRGTTYKGETIRAGMIFRRPDLLKKIDRKNRVKAVLVDALFGAVGAGIGTELHSTLLGASIGLAVGSLGILGRYYLEGARWNHTENHLIVRMFGRRPLY